jgi:hypothetical protein
VVGQAAGQRESLCSFASKIGPRNGKGVEEGFSSFCGAVAFCGEEA